MSTNANERKFPDCVEDWLKDNGPAGIVLRERLQGVEGDSSPVFPPTYPPPEERKKEEKSGYNISETRDGKICLIDSVGSQANRMEPLFMKGEYAKLVPQVTIKAGEKTVNLLDAGHRAGDAIVRCTDLADELETAFLAYRDKGDATSLAKIAPTSLVFGVWDSRGTQVKIPRILASVIHAIDVEILKRSAQYTPATEYGDKSKGLLKGVDGADNQKLLSKAGFSHAPSPQTPGGVLVRKEIRRQATISLVGIREIRSTNDANTKKLQRYILGLALTALTAGESRVWNLRQGCLLTRHPDSLPSLDLVSADGKRSAISIKHTDALHFAKTAATEFEVGKDKTTEFKKDRAKREIDKTKKEKGGE